MSETTGNTFSSTWVGIDGFGNSDQVFQAGTEQDWGRWQSSLRVTERR